MNDAGDLVALAELEEGCPVGAVQLLDQGSGAGVVGEEAGQAAGSVLSEQAGLAEVEQHACGVRADEAEAASDQDHVLATRR